MIALLGRAPRAIAGAVGSLWRRAWCAATLGHDPLFGEKHRVDVNGWWAYPCRKCGRLLFPSVWGGTDERALRGVELDA